MFCFVFFRFAFSVVMACVMKEFFILLDLDFGLNLRLCMRRMIRNAEAQSSPSCEGL